MTDFKKANTDATITQLIVDSPRAVLFLSAEWCGDCRVLDPFLPELCDTISQTATWVSADRDDNLAVAQEYKLRGIPAFVLFENGKEITRLGTGQRLTPQEILAWYQDN